MDVTSILPRQGNYLAGALACGPVVAWIVGEGVLWVHGPMWLAVALALFAAWVSGAVWMRAYRRQCVRCLLRLKALRHEFDCPECGDHIVSYSPVLRPPRCARCTLQPGWFLGPRAAEYVKRGRA